MHLKDKFYKIKIYIKQCIQKIFTNLQYISYDSSGYLNRTYKRKLHALHENVSLNFALFFFCNKPF